MTKIHTGSVTLEDLYTVIVSDGEEYSFTARCHELDLDSVLNGYRRLDWVRRIVTLTPGGNVMVWER